MDVGIECPDCGNTIIGNMKFGVIEYECDHCGYYTELLD